MLHDEVRQRDARAERVTGELQRDARARLILDADDPDVKMNGLLARKIEIELAIRAGFDVRRVDSEKQAAPGDILDEACDKIAVGREPAPCS